MTWLVCFTWHAGIDSGSSGGDAIICVSFALSSLVADTVRTYSYLYTLRMLYPLCTLYTAATSYLCVLADASRCPYVTLRWIARRPYARCLCLRSACHVALFMCADCMMYKDRLCDWRLFSRGDYPCALVLLYYVHCALSWDRNDLENNVLLMCVVCIWILFVSVLIEAVTFMFTICNNRSLCDIMHVT